MLPTGKVPSSPKITTGGEGGGGGGGGGGGDGGTCQGELCLPCLQPETLITMGQSACQCPASPVSPSCPQADIEATPGSLSSVLCEQ